MEMRQLEYFLSCASCLNFSLAAKYHYVSVSTISRSISALEDELGVRLFVRGYHGHSLTREGKRFYNFAESVFSSMSDFWQSIHRLGAANPTESKLLRIACYPFDHMFGRVVEQISGYPTDFLGKAYCVYFLRSGTMPEAVADGRMHLGIDTETHLRPYGDQFRSVRFFRSPLKLVVGSGSPLHRRRAVSAEWLVSQFAEAERYLPLAEQCEQFGRGRLESPKDLKIVGELTESYLPRLLPMLSGIDLDSHFLLLPQELDLPALLDFHTVRLNSAAHYTDYMLFWRREENDAALQRFVKIMETST